MKKYDTAWNLTNLEIDSYKKIVTVLRESPISDDQILKALPIYLTRSSLSHILFIDSMYKKIINT